MQICRGLQLDINTVFIVKKQKQNEKANVQHMDVPSPFALVQRNIDIDSFLKDLLEVFFSYIVSQIPQKQGVVWRSCSCEREEGSIMSGLKHFIKAFPNTSDVPSLLSPTKSTIKTWSWIMATCFCWHTFSAMVLFLNSTKAILLKNKEISFRLEHTYLHHNLLLVNIELENLKKVSPFVWAFSSTRKPDFDSLVKDFQDIFFCGINWDVLQKQRSGIFRC